MTTTATSLAHTLVEEGEGLLELCDEIAHGQNTIYMRMETKTHRRFALERDGRR